MRQWRKFQVQLDLARRRAGVHHRTSHRALQVRAQARLRAVVLGRALALTERQPHRERRGAVVGGGYTGSGHNEWVKLLPRGEFALVFVSNEDTPTDVTCDAACFAQVAANATAYSVRDLWGHATVGVLSPPLSLTAKQLPIHGGVAMWRFSPVQAVEA